MKNIRNKFIGFFINLFFSLIWFIVSIYIWDYVDAWLEYKNSFYEVFWVAEYYIFIPIPITFLWIFWGPLPFISKYIWFKKKKRKIKLQTYCFDFDI